MAKKLQFSLRRKKMSKKNDKQHEAAQEPQEQEQVSNSENQEQTANSEEQVMDEMTELKKSLEEARDKFVRLNAEFDNFRKRTARERVELFKTAGEDIMSTLLPVLDDFERGLDAMDKSEDVSSLKEGVNLVYDKLFKALKAKGLESFSAKGEVFDPELHEAVTKIPAPDKKMKGKVVDEIEKGYKLGDKIIRYAKVVVGE
jgi:molecular chaperone GrpE